MPGENVLYVDEDTGKPINPNVLGQGAGASAYPPFTSSRSDKADLLDKIRPDLIVETLRHKLMGEEQGADGKWVKVPALKHRAISEAGAWDITNLMLSVSSQNVSLSKLKDHEIRARTLEIVRTAQEMMLKNWKVYDIKGSDQLSFVHQIVMSNTLITLKQPEGGGIRDLIKGTTTETRMVSSQERERKLGMGLFRL